MKVTLVHLFFKPMFPNISQHNSAGFYLFGDIVTPSLCLLMVCWASATVRAITGWVVPDRCELMMVENHCIGYISKLECRMWWKVPGSVVGTLYTTNDESTTLFLLEGTRRINPLAVGMRDLKTALGDGDPVPWLSTCPACKGPGLHPQCN